MSKKSKHKKIATSTDKNVFDASSLSAETQQHLHNLHFVDEQILQKNNELEVADSARIVYTSVLKTELIKIKT